jgi:diguanylate cyclase (GGDEF)-like protein
VAEDDLRGTPSRPSPSTTVHANEPPDIESHITQPGRYQKHTTITSGDSRGTVEDPTQLVDSLQPFLELAGLESELTSLSAHLQSLLERIAAQWPGARVQLLCLAEEARETLSGPDIHTVSRQDVDAVPHHAEALRKGDVSLATSAPVNAPMFDSPVAAAVPVRVLDRDWGLLEVTWPSLSERSMQQQVLLLRSIAHLIELAIQNQNTMENLVFIDPLTGVYNRGFYERQVALEIERSHRTSRTFGLLVLDVDDFKRINDSYGHGAGDAVLAAVAHELSRKMRKIDLLFRYGGEEFVVLLPGAEQEETERTGERLRRIIDEMRFTSEAVPSDLKVTISVGAAVFPEHSRTQSGIFKAADEAMYRAKRQGKNRVAVSAV